MFSVSNYNIACLPAKYICNFSFWYSWVIFLANTVGYHYILVQYNVIIYDALRLHRVKHPSSKGQDGAHLGSTGPMQVGPMLSPWTLLFGHSQTLNSHKNTPYLTQTVGWVGQWGFLWWAPSAKGKDHHGVSSGWSSVWHCSNTGLSSSQYEQIPIILGVWPFCLTPFFFRSITFWRAYG